ncbi:MAG: head-tail adaptor protein [Candidatus Nanopelagicales bacterium]|nr:head-tail adaptor protein [Candidatus Nanopelagicales bacterium]
MIQAGDMRDLLSFRRPVKAAPNAVGEQIMTDDAATEYARERGRIEPLRGREVEQGRAVEAEATHRIHTWKVADVRHDDLIVNVSNGRRYEIVWTENVDEMDREMRHLVKERMN